MKYHQTMFSLKKFLLVVLVLIVAHLVVRAKVPTNQSNGLTNFSNCVLSEHKEVNGRFIARNAQLRSLSVTGNCKLNQTKITESLDVCGTLECKHSEIYKLSKIGNGKLLHSTITELFESTSPTDAQHCKFKSYDGTGIFYGDNLSVDEIFENTGKTDLLNSKLNHVKITGLFNGTQCSLDTCKVTGKTVLKNITCSTATHIVGETHCEHSIFKDLEICGKTHISFSTADTAEVTGLLEAKSCAVKEFTLTTQESFFDNCEITTLYVERNRNTPKKPSVIHISNTDTKNTKNFIRKIVCADPTTKIIYSQNAVHALEIIGTEHVISN